MSLLTKITFISIYVVQFFIVINAASYDTSVCIEDEFYDPYARVQKTRTKVVTAIQSTGFLDLRSYSGAFLFRDMEIGQKGEIIYTQSELKVYKHECFSFNRQAKTAYVLGVAPPPVTNSTTIEGDRVYGLVLVAASGDYRQPQKFWFQHPEFGYYSSNTIVNGSSFAIVNPGPGNNDTRPYDGTPQNHCFSIDAANITANVTLMGQYGKESQICTRSEAEDEVDSLFHKDLAKSDYKWYTCPPIQFGYIAPASGTPPPPVVNDTFDDWRIIDPAHLTAAGSVPVPLKPGLPGYPKPKINISSIPDYTKPFPPGACFPGEACYIDPNKDPPKVNNNDKTQRQFYEVSVADCHEFPEVDTQCDATGAGADVKSCELIKVILTIDEPKLKNDTELAPGSWRTEFLTLLSSIYSIVCPLYVYYMVKNPSARDELKKRLPRNDEWKNYISDLTKCKENAKNIELRKARDKAAEKLLAEAEEWMTDPKNITNLNLGLSRLQDENLKYQFKIAVMRNGQPQDINHFIETSDIDYEYNWPIDSQWKIFSTVIGYCSSYYNAKRADNFMKLYSLFTDDFMTPLSNDTNQKPWTDSSDNFIFDQLLGEYKKGAGSIWVDACLEGAYVHSDTVCMRPLRPLMVTAGETQMTENFFIDAEGKRNCPPTA